MNKTFEKRIYVTQKHIDAGKRNDCDDCPIALAIGDAFPSWRKSKYSYHVQVGFEILLFIESHLHRTIASYHAEGTTAEDRAISKFIKRFDKGLSVAPFSFNLRLVREQR